MLTKNKELFDQPGVGAQQAAVQEGTSLSSAGRREDAGQEGEGGRLQEEAGQEEETEVGSVLGGDEEGRELLRRSLELSQELQDTIGESNVLELMGRDFLRRGQVCVCVCVRAHGV